MLMLAILSLETGYLLHFPLLSQEIKGKGRAMGEEMQWEKEGIES